MQSFNHHNIFNYSSFISIIFKCSKFYANGWGALCKCVRDFNFVKQLPIPSLPNKIKHNCLFVQCKKKYFLYTFKIFFPQSILYTEVYNFHFIAPKIMGYFQSMKIDELWVNGEGLGAFLQRMQNNFLESQTTFLSFGSKIQRFWELCSSKYFAGLSNPFLASKCECDHGC